MLAINLSASSVLANKGDRINFLIANNEKMYPAPFQKEYATDD